MGKASEKFWELESRLPDRVKSHTDKVIRTGAKILRPFSEDTQRRGEKWYKAQRKKLRI
jgi:hypothetical protein